MTDTRCLVTAEERMIFISYKSEEIEIAAKIRAVLESNLIALSSLHLPLPRKDIVKK